MGGVVRVIAGIGLFALGAFTPVKFFMLAGALAAAQGAAQALSKPRSNLAPFDPKSINVDPATLRKLVLGRSTFAMDVRYAEPSGTDQEFIDYIIALAAHKSDAVESVYFEDDLAWTAGGGAQGKYAGYLTIEIILEAGASAFHTVNAGATWGSTRRLTGCTTAKIRVKRSANSKSSQSPFANGIGGRWTIIGRGMPVYDPALDSTVAGGSGTQRATNQATWAYTAGSVARGNNPALQLLAYLLGWRIGGVVSVGVGLAPDLIDLPSFAAAAALCDESVALAAGGTQRRFEAGRTFTDADDPLAVIGELLKAMNGELTDDTGRLALRIAVNDLTPALTFTDDDIVGPFSWQPQPPLDQQYTVVRGRYTQPDAPALFNLADFPEVAIPRQSNAPRALPLELPCVQEQRRAERIAKQAAQRSLYGGMFSVTIGVRGWLLRRNMVVAWTSNARGWVAKMFRVRSMSFNTDGTVEVVFREEDASIYAWDASESALVTPVAPVVFDPRNAASWLMAEIEPGATDTRETVPAMPKGVWTTGLAIVQGDIVFDANATWTANTAHTTAAGNRPGIDNTWTLLVAAPDTTNLGTSSSVTFSTGTLTGTSYGSPAGSFSVRAGAGGIVDLSINGFAELESGTSAGTAAKAQRWTGSMWVDVGSEAAGPTATDTTPTPAFTASWQATGLTNGTSYDFRVLGRRTGGSSGSEVSISGIFTGVGR